MGYTRIQIEKFPVPMFGALFNAMYEEEPLNTYAPLYFPFPVRVTLLSVHVYKLLEISLTAVPTSPIAATLSKFIIKTNHES